MVGDGNEWETGWRWTGATWCAHWSGTPHGPAPHDHGDCGVSVPPPGAFANRPGAAGVRQDPGDLRRHRSSVWLQGRQSAGHDRGPENYLAGREGW